MDSYRVIRANVGTAVQVASSRAGPSPLGQHTSAAPHAFTSDSAVCPICSTTQAHSTRKHIATTDKESVHSNAHMSPVGPGMVAASGHSFVALDNSHHSRLTSPLKDRASARHARSGGCGGRSTAVNTTNRRWPVDTDSTVRRSTHLTDTRAWHTELPVQAVRCHSQPRYSQLQSALHGVLDIQGGLFLASSRCSVRPASHREEWAQQLIELHHSASRTLLSAVSSSVTRLDLCLLLSHIQ